MSTTLESASVGTPQNAEIVMNFDPKKVRAPFFLRCGAILADYMLLVFVPVIGLLLGRYFGNDGARLLGGGLNDASWLVAALLGFTNLIVLPFFFGQSIGKMIVGIRILRLDGKPVSLGRILLRQTLGYFLTALTLGLGFLIAALSSKGRTLHDLMAGTVVIYADRKII
jgi:uncharacterized RDD family membrane protein YckC